MLVDLLWHGPTEREVRFGIFFQHFRKVLGKKIFLPLAPTGDVQHRDHGVDFDVLPIAQLAFPFDAHDD